jgi:hypothetical protein
LVLEEHGLKGFILLLGEHHLISEILDIVDETIIFNLILLEGVGGLFLLGDEVLFFAKPVD